MGSMKKLIIILSLVLLTLSLLGCESNEERLNYRHNSDFAPGEEDPPVLNISYENKTIHAVRGTYSWHTSYDDGSETMRSSDSEGPIELVKNTSPLKVPPKSTITLNFSDEPKEVIVKIWEEDKEIQQALTDMKVTVPELEGSVIYEVISTWEQGTVHYAFLVNVD